jgi:glycosyltransferase involved in cell wall biosynthesis
MWREIKEQANLYWIVCYFCGFQKTGMATKGLVSVCIPAFNNGRFIAETLNSVLGQTYQNIEVIVVDDCSEDDTVSQIEQLADDRVRLIKNERNLGMHGNWSKALSYASGEFIKLVCGDDLLLPGCIELQAAVLNQQANTDVALVACRRKVIRADGSEISRSFYKLPPGKYRSTTVMKACITLGNNLIAEPMAVMFRSSVFTQNNIRLGSNNYLIDLDMYSKILVHGNFIMMKEYLAAFRIYSASVTGSLGRKKHSRFFREFAAQPWLKEAFGISRWHRMMGSVLESAVSLARVFILKLSLRNTKI